MLVGTFLIVFVGALYVMFFADIVGVAPDSISINSPISEKLYFLGFLAFALLIGLLINRLAWRGLINHFSMPQEDDQAQDAGDTDSRQR